MATLIAYGDVIDDSIAEYYDENESFISPSLVKDFLDSHKGEKVKIELSTGGGSVNAGAQIYHEMQKFDGEITVIMVGVVASIGTVIALAGDKLLATPLTRFMIHNAFVEGMVSGGKKELENLSEFLDITDGQISDIYASKSNLSKNELEEMMNNETWLDTKQLEEFGFLDGVLTSRQEHMLASNSINKKGRFSSVKTVTMSKSKQNLLNRVSAILNKVETKEVEVQEQEDVEVPTVKVETEKEEVAEEVTSEVAEEVTEEVTAEVAEEVTEEVTAEVTEESKALEQVLAKLESISEVLNAHEETLTAVVPVLEKLDSEVAETKSTMNSFKNVAKASIAKPKATEKVVKADSPYNVNL